MQILIVFPHVSSIQLEILMELKISLKVENSEKNSAISLANIV